MGIRPGAFPGSVDEMFHAEARPVFGLMMILYWLYWRTVLDHRGVRTHGLINGRRSFEWSSVKTIHVHALGMTIFTSTGKFLIRRIRANAALNPATLEGLISTCNPGINLWWSRFISDGFPEGRAR